MDSIVGLKEQEGTLAELQDAWSGSSALERGRKLRDLRAAGGHTHMELAKAAGCQESLVRQLIKLAELAATVLEEYEAGEIGRKKALELGKKLQQVKPPRVDAEAADLVRADGGGSRMSQRDVLRRGIAELDHHFIRHRLQGRSAAQTPVKACASETTSAPPPSSRPQPVESSRPESAA